MKPPAMQGQTDPPGDGGLGVLLGRFGFGDPWDSWMERIREIEWPRSIGTIGPYEIIGEAGRGGQGIVYKARVVASGRLIALKKLVAGSLATAESRRRLEREMEAAAAVDCDAVVRVFGIDSVDGQPLLAMEWIDGRPVTRWAQEEARSPREAARLLAEVCDAVQHAHLRGVIHRDLKPSNILVDRAGRARVLDFGVAGFVHPATERLTHSGQFLGTPGYAAPEQIAGRGAPADVRVDIYALGAVLHELITGRPPGADGPGDAATARRGPDADLGAIARRATRLDPAHRYQSAAAMAADLRAFAAGRPIAPGRAGRARLVVSWARTHRVAAGFAATVAALVIGWGAVAGVLSYRLARRSEQAHQAQRRADRINAFLFDILGKARPGAESADAAVLAAVDAAASSVEHALGSEPEVCAAAQEQIGRIYLGIRMYERAQPHLRRAVEILRASRGSDPGPGLLEALSDLGECLIGQGDPAAVGVEQEALDLARRAGPRDEAVIAERTLALADALWACADDGRQGEPLARKAVEHLDRLLSADDPRRAGGHAVLGARLAAERRWEAARDELRGAMAVLGPFLSVDKSEHQPAAAECAFHLAGCELALGRAAAADELMIAAMPVHHCLYGGTRDGPWWWRRAEIEHALGGTGIIEMAHTALAAAWMNADPARGRFAGTTDWSRFFSDRPLASADAGVYAARVRAALAKLGGSEAEQAARAAWLEGVLRGEGFPDAADALAGLASGSASGPLPAPG